MTALYPLLLEPSLHVKVWGGRKLESVMGKSLPTNEPYGESWEMHDTSTVVNGALAGSTLSEVLAQYGADLIGAQNDPSDGMPLLVKFIDGSDWLSVQVHPDDAQAAELEGQPRGKTEAWYILSTDENAELVIGVKPGTDRDEMAAAIRENRLEDLIVKSKIRAGDVLYIPAGTVHAVGPGTLLYEIQQSSNTTYRLYDWGRMGLDGNPRELHIEKGVQVSNVESLPIINHVDDDNSPVVTVVSGEFFTTTLHRVGGSVPMTLNTGGRFFHSLTCIKGSCTIQAGETTITLDTGRTAMIPARVGEYELSGGGEVLRSWQTV